MGEEAAEVEVLPYQLGQRAVGVEGAPWRHEKAEEEEGAEGPCWGEAGVEGPPYLVCWVGEAVGRRWGVWKGEAVVGRLYPWLGEEVGGLSCGEEVQEEGLL